MEPSEHSWSGAMARNNSPGSRYPTINYRSANQRFGPPSIGRMPNEYSGCNYYPWAPIANHRPAIKIERPSRNVVSVNQVIDISSEEEELDDGVVVIQDGTDTGIASGLVQIEVSASVYHQNGDQYFDPPAFEENNGAVFPYSPVDFSGRNRLPETIPVLHHNNNGPSTSHVLESSEPAADFDNDNSNDTSDEPMNLSNRMKRSSDVVNININSIIPEHHHCILVTACIFAGNGT